METIWIVNPQGRRLQAPAAWWRERRPRLLPKGWRESNADEDRRPATDGRNRILPTPPVLFSRPTNPETQTAKPRLAHVMPWPLSVGGAQRMIHEWCVHFGECWRTTVIAPGGNRAFGFPNAEVYDAVDAEQAMELLRAWRPAVVVHHGPQFDYGRYQPESGALFWVIHGEYVLHSTMPRWGQPKEIFVNSPSPLCHGSWPPLTVLPLGVDVQRFTPGEGGRLSSPVAGIVGRLSMEKLPLGFLQALQSWEPGPWRLRFIGEGRWNPWIERVRQETAALPFVELRGDVAPGDMPSEYRQLAALVAPSMEETGSYAVVEAMASGLPIVARAVGGIPFTADGAALLGDTDQQLLTTLRSLDTAERREYWGRRAREKAEARHDGARHAERHHVAFVAALAPWISIVCPVRDTPASFLREMWDSIRGQTLACWELVLVDDGSRDERTQETLRQMAVDPRVRLIRFAEPVGISTALNMGIESARSEWIARMDGDDVMMPERLAKQWEYCRRHPEVEVLGAQLAHWDGQTIGRATSHPAVIDDRIVQGSDWFLNHPTVLLRKSSWRRVGGYDSTLPVAEDLDLWLRLRADGATMHNLPEVLLWYRTHPGQVTRRNRLGDWIRQIRAKQGNATATSNHDRTERES